MTIVDATSPHAFHKPQASYSYDDLLKSGSGKLFGPGNAQLPTPPMLMLDRITSIDLDGGPHKRGRIVAELDIRPDLWFFACHFPGDPVMPGCLGLDAMWQLVGFWLGWSGSPGKGRAIGVGECSFTGQVKPTNKLVRYEIDIRRAIRARLVMGIADGSVFLDGEKIYQASDLKVGMIKQ